MATTNAAIEKAPLPAELDPLAEQFHDLELGLSSARREVTAKQAALAKMELEFIELVRSHGSTHAEKSKILHGIVWEMVATFSQYTTQDGAAIERFREALVKAKKTRLLKKIFEADTRWTMKASAAEIVKTEQLTPTLMALLLQCSVTKDRKPSLDVRQKKKPA
ncbi:MAG TPA: hypothetical protein VGM18_04800 [Candidatus Sulfotelmatobacter sp.]|jgi:hypothetical protein